MSDTSPSTEVKPVSEFDQAQSLVNEMLDLPNITSVLETQLSLTPERAKELCIAGITRALFPNQFGEHEDELELIVWTRSSVMERRDNLQRFNSGTAVKIDL